MFLLTQRLPTLPAWFIMCTYICSTWMAYAAWQSNFRAQSAKAELHRASSLRGRAITAWCEYHSRRRGKAAQAAAAGAHWSGQRMGAVLFGWWGWVQLRKTLVNKLGRAVGWRQRQLLQRSLQSWRDFAWWVHGGYYRCWLFWCNVE